MFGSGSSKSIKQITWPDSMRQLSFGKKFTRPTGEVKRSKGLRKLTVIGDMLRGAVAIPDAVQVVHPACGEDLFYDTYEEWHTAA